MKRVLPNRHRRLPLKTSAAVLAGITLWTGAASAVDRYWGNVGTDYNTGSNWITQLPAAADRGIFSGPIFSPVVSGPASAAGFTFYEPGFTLSGANGPITLTSDPVNSDYQAALYVATAGVTTISTSLVLGATSPQRMGFSVVLGAELIVSGDISGTNSLQKLGTGILTLSGNNTFSGGVLGNGTNGRFGLTRLNINSNTALGTGIFSVGQGNGGSTFGNSSGAARTLANVVAFGGGSGLQSTWDLPANGSGNLTFTGGSTVGSGAHTVTVLGGTLALQGALSDVAGAATTFAKTGSGTLVLGGAVSNLVTVTLGGGKLILDMSTGGSFANPALAMNLTNATFGLKGVTSGTSAQAIGAPTFGGRSGIMVDGNGGAGTTLTVGSTWTRNAGVTLDIELQGNSVLAATPAVSAGSLVIGSGTAAFAIVKDEQGTGFATVSVGNVVRYKDAATLDEASNGFTTNFITKVGDDGYLGGNTLTLFASPHAFNTLQIDTSGGDGVIEIGPTPITFTDKGLLVTGDNSFTVQGGILGGVAELVVHQHAVGTLTVSSLIGGAASNGASLTKAGPGTMILSANNLYTGLTTVNDGTLRITGSIKGALTITGSTVATSGNVSLEAAGAVAQGTINVNGVGTLNQTVDNAISGTAAVSVNGLQAGPTANLSHANNYSGNTTITAGNLNVGHSAAIGTGTLIFGNGAKFNNTSGGPLTLVNNNPINITAGFIFTGTDSLNMGAGAVSLTSGVRTLAVMAKTLAFDGSVSGAGGINKIGAGTLVLSGSNSYTGSTAVEGGVLLLNHLMALPGGLAATGGLSNLAVNNGGIVGLTGDLLRPLGTTATDVQVSTNGGGFAAFGARRVVNLGGANAPVTWNTPTVFLPNNNSGGSVTFTLGAPGADATLDFQNPINLNGATRTILVNNGSASVDAVLSGVISNSTGTAGFTKVGTGTLEMTASNTYNGPTVIVAGRLIVTGELFGTNGITVAGGATLAGAGSLFPGTNGSSTMFNGSILEPGSNGPGILTVSLSPAAQLNIAAAADGAAWLKFELGTVSDEVILASGFLNLGFGTLDLADFVFSDSGGFGAGQYVLFDTSTDIFGILGDNVTGTVLGLPATLSMTDDLQDIVLTVVPEPGATALLLGGLGWLAARRNRRRA